jgi:plasmid rolling circle replication initiator protein Rep
MRRSPFLDNIETSGTPQKTLNPLTHKGNGEQNEKNLYTPDLEKILSDMEETKRLSVETAVSLLDFGSDVFKDRARMMYDCGDNVSFSGGKVVAADFCRQRLCPMCQRRKSLKTYSDFCKVLGKLGGFSFLHMVLTVPNVAGDELNETLDLMNGCASRFFKILELAKPFKGVARVTEISYNDKRGDFHPHFHCLVAVKPSYFKSRDYLKYDTLRFLWSAVWYHRHDNLKRLTDEKIKLSNLSDSDLLQVFITKADEGALPEIAKYAVKPLTFKATRKQRAEILQTLFEGLHGRRLIQTYGVIRDAAKSAKVTFDECVELDTLDKSDIVSYNYNHRLTRYERR